METLHKLAGVQDTSDLHSPPRRPSHPHIIPEPPPIPHDDAHPLGQSHSAHSSRASLPLHRRRSGKSVRSGGGRSRSHSREHVRAGAGSHGVDLSGYPATPQLDRGEVEEALAAQSQSQSQAPGSPHQRQRQRSHPSAPGREPPPRRSHSTARTRTTHATTATATTTSAADDDFTWGPTHPCFPHPNPHADPGSPAATATRVIRVRRDWLPAGDLYPQFANLYPEILDPLVSEAEFRALIGTLNGKLAAAFSPFTARAWVDAVLGVVTGWLWEDGGGCGVKGRVGEVERWVEGWNAGMERQGREVRVVSLRRTGFMALDLVIPDPGIDEVGGSEEGREGEGGIGAAE